MQNPRFAVYVPRRRPLLTNRMALAIGVSLLVHAVALAIRFKPPDAVKLTPIDTPLEVILLNATNKTRPVKPDVAAQVSMEAGGDRDKGRAKSPLIADTKVEDGDSLAKQRSRVEELEKAQRRLFAKAGGDKSLPTEAEKTFEPAVDPSKETEDVKTAISRLQAEISKRIEDYNKRPRRLTYGVNAVGVSYARYVDDWVSRIERIGTERYPTEARGKQYDSLIVLVEIDKSGNVVDVAIKKPSKFEVLNKAARTIVYAGAPYERFTDEMARDGDILQIVRTWYFTNNTLETTSIE
jgi:protein TonB